MEGWKKEGKKEEEKESERSIGTERNRAYGIEVV